MNAEDYAIVVGVRRYPGLGRTESDPQNLEGPDNDATGVYDWLTRPDGGGVPAANAELIRSQDFADPFPSVLAAEPQKQAIETAFSRLDSIAEQHNRAGQGLRVGRRLYIYMSGHGFAPRRKQAALFLANATRRRTFHIHGSAWMDWFYNAQYFDEYVLWMDCCMIFDLSVIAEGAGFRVLQSTTGGGNVFASFAARPPLQTVERQMPDGRAHGVFTYTLMKGLEGGAADRTSLEITSESLRRYMTTAMKTFLTDSDLQDASIAQEPDFGADDPIVFAKLAALPAFNVKMSFPAAAEGRRVRVVTGSPIREAASAVVHGGACEVPLPTGVYFAIVDDIGLVKDFVVTEGTDIAIAVGV